MENPVSGLTAGKIMLSDYVFSIAYAYKIETDKIDYYRLEMTYDCDKILSLNKKYKVDFSFEEFDAKYDKKEYNNTQAIDKEMENLLIFMGDKFIKSTGKKPKNLSVMKGYNDNNTLFFYTFFLKKSDQGHNKGNDKGHNKGNIKINNKKKNKK